MLERNWARQTLRLALDHPYRWIATNCYSRHGSILDFSRIQPVFGEPPRRRVSIAREDPPPALAGIDVLGVDIGNDDEALENTMYVSLSRYGTQ